MSEHTTHDGINGAMTTGPEAVRSVGIIGAGVMGRGIAEVSARAGLRVKLLDQDPAVAASAVQTIKSVAPRAAAVSVALNEEEISAADLIIEAVPEDLAIKTEILSRLDSHLGQQTIVASNTSSLSIAQLGAALKDPSRFCGLHFCLPVVQRPLVEVIRAGATDSTTMDRAVGFTISVGLSPIIVPDSPGFLLNRLLVSYMNEALELVLDGATVESLDRVARDFGMPIGPLALFDEIGMDVAMAVGQSLLRAFPERIVPSELLVAMYKSGRRGRKSCGGFYLSREDAVHGRLDPVVVELIQERRRNCARPADSAVMQRLFLPMLLEATRTLQESLVTSPMIIDTALRDGLGMTRSYAGLFGWADRIGAATIMEWLRPLQSLGKRFEPTPQVVDAATHDSLIAGCRAA
ncbi:MAG TPA: 3-hydroxyacyl-CoA dehydrogenase [Planctomycetes bacterium]|nr:3-hydroxyacyl-CoA dehydrogenase [Fuerstiella sp.]HIK90830.1 3-hydroxyacyl-CoA dehydrogenase [Planctomycetota bacterium]